MSATRCAIVGGVFRFGRFGHSPRHEDFLMSLDRDILIGVITLQDALWKLGQFNLRHGESYFLLMRAAEVRIALGDFDLAQKCLEQCEWFDIEGRDHEILSLLISWTPPDKWVANEHTFQSMRELLGLSSSEENSLLVLQNFLERHGRRSILDFQYGLIGLLDPIESERCALFAWFREFRKKQPNHEAASRSPVRILRHDINARAHIFEKFQPRPSFGATLRLMR